MIKPIKSIPNVIISTSLIFIFLAILTGCGPVIKKFDPIRGDTGTPVTIEGERFEDSTADNTVKFGNVPVPTSEIISASDKKIIAKVPNGAVTAQISVTDSKNRTGRSKKNFIVNDPDQAKWTFMVYLDSDNNLESAGLDDFLEMASVGSTDEVNIVVQMDRVDWYSTAYGNWKDTRRFLIRQGDTPSGAPVQNLGEQNMGDPAVLQDFVEWAVTNYPAEHYILSIWNHGDGWRRLHERMIRSSRSAISRGFEDAGITRAVATDETDGNDKLYMKEVQLALQAAKSNMETRTNTYVKLDVVGFDACLMGMVEVAHALRDVTNYVVGSEDLEPGDGWPYDTILSELVGSPTMSPDDLSKLIVQKYGAAYNFGITQAAVDISQLNNLVISIDAFTVAANTEWANLKAARNNAIDYHISGYPTCWGTDLWDFSDEVYSLVTSIQIKAAAANLKNAINNFVIEEHHSADRDGSHGIAIYFPPTQSEFNNDPDHTGYLDSNNYMPVDYVKQHSWDNWMQTYYSNIP